jgi:hypothetical protein
MSTFADFRQMCNLFLEGKKQVCGSRKPAANPPQTGRKPCRKPCRNPALNRKAAEPRNCPHMTRAMAQNHRPAKSFLLPFGKSSE